MISDPRYRWEILMTTKHAKVEGFCTLKGFDK